jgi:signal transduction histidine kinase
MSIRFRLTLLYSAILALTLIAFSGIVYATQARSIYADIRANLMHEAGFFTRSGAPDLGARDKPPLPEGALPPQRTDFILPSGTLPGRWTQTRTITGTITARTYDLSDTSLPLSDAGLHAVQNGQDWFEIADVQDQPLIIYSVSFLSRTGATEIVQLAFPIAQPQQSLYSLRLMLLAGAGFATLAAFAIGWVLAGAALRPIQGLTHTAQAIGAEHNFARRVQHTGPADEIGQLATTFNDMLAELESAYRQLEGALDSQRRFVADASHELRTPLTTVRGNVELLRREPPLAPDERAEILMDTTDEVDRLIRLVNQLLVLARVDAGQALKREPIALRPLLDDVCRQAKFLTTQASMQCDSPADVEVVGDRDALKQVLLILVDNAHVHTAPGTTVKLSTKVADDAVAISVRDTGPGIASDALPHIFERFYRGQVSRSGPGAGLGLAIARELVEAQDGKIEVESEVGKGTVFTVLLPQAGAAAAG